MNLIKQIKWTLLLAALAGRLLLAGGVNTALFVIFSRNDPETAGTSRHAAVLALNPVGYWPADQGEGDVLHDLSSTGNHGVIHHVPWDKQRQLLNFTGAYEWLEIPKHEAYQTLAFSMGGWVFLRSDVIGGGWVNRQGLVLIGNQIGNGSSWHQNVGVQLSIRKQQVIDVVSDGKEDVLGTRLWVPNVDTDNELDRIRFGGHSEGKPLAIGQWHHLLYCFETNSNLSQAEAMIGTGRLYLNGELIAAKADIHYQPVANNLQVGCDAFWWHQIASKSGSLDGAVRDMVWFDRALAAEEAAQLHAATKPTVAPDVYDDTVIVLDGRSIAAHDLASLQPATRRTALMLFNRKDQATLQPLADVLLPPLTAALDEPTGRLQAVNLLLRLETDAASTALQQAVPNLIVVVQNEGNPQKERADAVLALAAMGKTAAEAVPALADTLDKLIPDAGLQPPRVDDLLRNALTRALLDIAPDHELARQTLERTYAAPLMALIEEPEGELRSLIEASRFWDAMQLYAQLPATDRERFFTYKAPQDRDFTATSRFNGCTYKVGTGVAWEGVEKVPEEEYKAIVAELARQYPDAETWRMPDHEHLYRVPITKIDSDGKQQTIYLEGKNFILDGEDEKLRGWSIFIDELGYIHLMGGQHNEPWPRCYIPGSWEQMGVSRDSRSDDFPLQMYWVSTAPECIESFEFAGRKSDPEAIPAGYLNYMVLEQSPNNETYLYGRVNSYNWQSWGLFRYEAEKKRWVTVGGDPHYIMISAKRSNPSWLDYLHGNIWNVKVPDFPAGENALVWAWQPAFYNFCRDPWGVRFDKTGRMHVHMQISGLDGAGYVRPSSVYAWSDDRGETFHRADGSRVHLPLTVNPAPEHNAEIAVDNTFHHHNGDQYDTRQWWQLWLGLLSDVSNVNP